MPVILTIHKASTMSDFTEYNRLLQCLTVAERKSANIYYDLCNPEEFSIYNAFSVKLDYERILKKIHKLTADIKNFKKREMAKVCALPPVLTSIVALYM